MESEEDEIAVTVKKDQSPSLLSRFFAIFTKRFPIAELKVHFVVAIAGVIFFVYLRHRTAEIWELLVPILLAATFIFLYHTIATAVRLIKDIAKEKKTNPTQRESPILGEFGRPAIVPIKPSIIPWYRFKIISIATVLCTFALVACFVVLRLSRLYSPSDSERKKIQPQISWSPNPLRAGEQLTEAQLNAEATAEGKRVDGKFVYNPALGLLWKLVFERLT